jgi:hypothetical protein
MISLSNTEWKDYEEKYGKLMWKISRFISGDKAIASVEDNYADLCVTAVESINGFHNKTGMSFSEMLGQKLFDQYTKTCLWNKKNNKGAKITKKAPILKRTVSVSNNEEVLKLESVSVDPDLEMFLEEMKLDLSDRQKHIINMVTEDPTLIKPNGKINVKAVSEKLKCTWNDVNKELHDLRRRFELSLGSNHQG